MEETPHWNLPPHARRIAYLVRDGLLSLSLAAIVILGLYQPVKVEGTSMMPSLVDQERIFINKYLYRSGVGVVERGDLVVFTFPQDPDKSYIKRVIGLPGDTVEIAAGNVLVNGQQLDEPYVPDEYRDRLSYPRCTIPPGFYFVLGDHRAASSDSRQWGPVPLESIYGKAVFVYWPPERAGVLR
jgi:signal peptidase I